MGFNDDFKERTKKFALRIIKLYQALPKTEESRIMGRQILRSGTSVAANFRAATRARSKREFNSKLCICHEEADETLFWIEMLVDSGIIEESKIHDLFGEALSITKMIAVSLRTSRNNDKKKDIKG